MRYIVIPIVKFAWAVVMMAIYAIIGVATSCFNFIWTFNFNVPYEDGWFQMDTNPGYLDKYSEFWRKDLIYKTPFHWAFNGNFRNFK